MADTAERDAVTKKRSAKTASAGAAIPADLPESQRRILDAAVVAFAETGFAGTATNEIARRAGVAEGTIFRYYPTKKALLIAAVGLLIKAMTPVVRAGLERLMNHDYGSVEEFVREVAVDRLAFAREHTTLVRLIVQEIPFHPELREKFRETALAVAYPLLLRAVTRMQERGLMAPIDPSSAARMILSVVMGFVLARVFISPDAQWDDEAELDTMARVLGRGLAPA